MIRYPLSANRYPLTFMPYEPTIGLEIHAELKTRTKMFCASLNDPLEKHPNINVCPVCLGHPGTLPVPNREAISMVQQVGAALNCTLAEFSKFDRKNYFYPDLPKGYQISQYDLPFCSGGYLDIPLSNTSQSASNVSQIPGRRIRIKRIHLEEDSGKLLHPDGSNETLVDFNRAGIPLMELVTEPDIHSGEEAAAFAQELQILLRYTGASEANMQSGQMRVEVNISLRKISQNNAEPYAKQRKTVLRSSALGSREAGVLRGSATLGTKVEIKNLNSFRSVRMAVEYEIARQTELLQRGETIIQETRGWHDTKQKTFSQRTKEEAQDYRYFPEPDIPPFRFPPQHLQRIRSSVPELPAAKRDRFAKQFKIPAKDISVLVSDKELADYFEEVLSELGAWQNADPTAVALSGLATLAVNYLLSDFVGLLRVKSMAIRESNISPENFAELIKLVAQEKITSRVAKDVLIKMAETGIDPSDLIEQNGLMRIEDAGKIRAIAEKIVGENAKAAEDFRNGKGAVLQFLVGQLMRETKGTMNPKTAAELFREILK